MTTPPRLLEGLRIVDMTSVVFGPYCTQLLAEMGADVIKVEPPIGDIFRRAGAPPPSFTMGACHLVLNRGKRSAVLDLKDSKDAALMHALLADADVFIHNVRRDAIGRLGFGYETIAAANPRLVYVHCTGYGSGGPYDGLQAYDDAIQAASGMTTFLSRVDGNPTPRYVPSTIADKVAGLYATHATLAAIVHRLRTGEGQHVEVPMFEAFTQFLYEEHLFTGAVGGPVGYPRQIDPNRQPFPTADGHITIVPYTDETWFRTFQVLGAPDVLTRPEFETPMDRAMRAGLLYAEIAKLTPARPTAEWLGLLHAAQVPAMAVRDLSTIKEDPHLAATGFFAPHTHPTEGPYVAMRRAARYSAAPEPELRHAPNLGEHTEELRALYGAPTRTAP